MLCPLYEQLLKTAPAGNNNVIITSTRHHDVVLTKQWRNYRVRCGSFSLYDVMILNCFRITGRLIPIKGPAIWMFDAFFVVSPDYLLNKQFSGRRFETPWSSCDITVMSCSSADLCAHDDVIKWKHFPRYWLFVRGIHRSPVNSPYKGQWRGALMFSLIFAWRNG